MIPISDPDLLMRVVLLIQLAAVVGTFILIRRAFVNAKFQHQYYWFVVMILVAINPLFVKILINGRNLHSGIDDCFWTVGVY